MTPNSSSSTVDNLAQSFELWVPISKAEPVDPGNPYGPIRVKGLASDESLDLDEERVCASKFPQAFDYLVRYGKFNYDHGSTDVGDVTQVRFMKAAEAQRLYADYGVKPEGNVVEVEGIVYPINDLDLINRSNPDLVKTHGMVSCGAKLGFSLQGSVLNRSARKSVDGSMEMEAVPKLVNKVAITPQPKNHNTICTICKSLAGVLEESESDIESATPLEHAPEHPPILVMTKALLTPGQWAEVPDDEEEELTVDAGADAQQDVSKSRRAKFEDFDTRLDDDHEAQRAGLNAPGLSIRNSSHRDPTFRVRNEGDAQGVRGIADNPQSNIIHQHGHDCCRCCGFGVQRGENYCPNCGGALRSLTEVGHHSADAGVVARDFDGDGAVDWEEGDDVDDLRPSAKSLNDKSLNAPGTTGKMDGAGVVLPPVTDGGPVEGAEGAGDHEPNTKKFRNKPRRCRRCGAAMHDDHKYCPICGTVKHALHEVSHAVHKGSATLGTDLRAGQVIKGTAEYPYDVRVEVSPSSTFMQGLLQKAAAQASVSLGKLLAGVGHGADAVATDEDVAPEVAADEEGVQKALAATGIVATEGTTGGDSLKFQDVGKTIAVDTLSTGAKAKGTKSCPKCGQKDIPAGEGRCPKCGVALSKSLGDLVAEIEQATAPRRHQSARQKPLRKSHKPKLAAKGRRRAAKSVAVVPPSVSYFLSKSGPLSKSRTIKNAPGLRLDPTKRRWVKDTYAIGQTRSGKAIPSVTSAPYQTKHRVRGYTSPVAVTSSIDDRARRTILRHHFPDWSAADHTDAAVAHEAAAADHRVAHRQVNRRADQDLQRRGVDAGPLISGVVSEKYPDKVKDRLRTLAHRGTKHLDAARAHRAAAKYLRH